MLGLRLQQMDGAVGGTQFGPHGAVTRWIICSHASPHWLDRDGPRGRNVSCCSCLHPSGGAAQPSWSGWLTTRWRCAHLRKEVRSACQAPLVFKDPRSFSQSIALGEPSEAELDIPIPRFSSLRWLLHLKLIKTGTSHCVRVRCSAVIRYLYTLQSDHHRSLWWSVTIPLVPSFIRLAHPPSPLRLCNYQSVPPYLRAFFVLFVLCYEIPHRSEITRYLLLSLSDILHLA